MLDNLCKNCFNKIDSATVCPKCGYSGNSPKDKETLNLGAILNGKYIIGRVLGRGGFGVTYLGYDLNLNIKVAIKEYLPNALVTRINNSPQIIIPSENKATEFNEGLDKFISEARIVAMFAQNPNIVSIREFFPENKTAYMVMDYIEGIDLAGFVLKKGKPLSFIEALKLLNPLMSALQQVHSVGLLHRDISPDNIYITEEGTPILLDFGAARQYSSQTKSMSVILKLGYAPIEQHQRKGKSGPWTDVYAFAATFYHVITGKRPPEALDRLEEEILIPPSAKGIDIPKSAEAALIKALSVRSKDRFQTMDAFSNEINACMQDMIKEQQRREEKEVTKSQISNDIGRVTKSKKLRTPLFLLVPALCVAALITLLVIFIPKKPFVKDVEPEEISETIENQEQELDLLDVNSEEDLLSEPATTANQDLDFGVLTEEMLIGRWLVAGFHTKDFLLNEVYNSANDSSQTIKHFILMNNGVSMSYENVDEGELGPEWYINDNKLFFGDSDASNTSSGYIYCNGRLLQLLSETPRWYELEKDGNFYQGFINNDQPDSDKFNSEIVYSGEPANDYINTWDYTGSWFGEYKDNSVDMVMRIEIYPVKENGDSLDVEASFFSFPQIDFSVGKGMAYSMQGNIEYSSGYIWLNAVERLDAVPSGYEMLDLVGFINNENFEVQLNGKPSINIAKW
jgi:serine/threonine protein kinase